jgi:hypothetical protein
MGVTKKRDRAVGLCVALATVLFVTQGCGSGGDAMSKFTGGSNSKDKAPIAAAAATTSAQPAQATPPVGMEKPAVAEKQMETAMADDPNAPIRETSMEYRASGSTRDPFLSLVGGENRSELIDLSVVTLVAVVGGEDPFGVVEDAEGSSYVLRQGDRVKNGRVVSIKPNALVASQTILGYTTTVQLKLVEERKDVKHG